MSNWADLIGGLILTLAIIVVLSLLFRELVMWYWKVNERISLMKAIIARLEDIAMGSRLGGTDNDSEAEKPEFVTCPQCGESIQADSKFCEQCGYALPS